MTVNSAYPPRLADGIELLGELKDSGFAEPRSLIRRSDGQVIQLSRLLYLVSCRTSATVSDPRATGLRRGARMVITAWVLCVIPLLAIALGFMLLHLPEFNRALWQSAVHAARLLAVIAAIACAVPLSVVWLIQGQFGDW